MAARLHVRVYIWYRLLRSHNADLRLAGHGVRLSVSTGWDIGESLALRTILHPLEAAFILRSEKSLDLLLVLRDSQPHVSRCL